MSNDMCVNRARPNWLSRSGDKCRAQKYFFCFFLPFSFEEKYNNNNRNTIEKPTQLGKNCRLMLSTLNSVYQQLEKQTIGSNLVTRKRAVSVWWPAYQLKDIYPIGSVQTRAGLATVWPTKTIFQDDDKVDIYFDLPCNDIFVVLLTGCWSLTNVTITIVFLLFFPKMKNHRSHSVSLTH